MSGLASLAMAIDRLDQQQSSPTTVQTSFVETTKPHQQLHAAQPHSWVSSTERIPQKEYFKQTARAVSVGSFESTDGHQVYTNTPATVVAPPKMNTPPEESAELVLDNPAENPPPAPPSPDDVIDKVQDDDVLCGRGGETNNHVGNIRYRDLVKKYQPQYLKAKRRVKPQIARQIVDTIRHRNGRFLKKVAGENTWRDVGNTKAREKTSQALREGAPELRAPVVPTSASSPTQVPIKVQIHRVVQKHHHAYYQDQECKKRKACPTDMLGSISPNAALVSPMPSNGSFEENYVHVPVVDCDARSAFLSIPSAKKQKRGPRLAILKARLQESSLC
jgi:hypothetical protein